MASFRFLIFFGMDGSFTVESCDVGGGSITLASDVVIDVGFECWNVSSSRLELARKQK